MRFESVLAFKEEVIAEIDSTLSVTSESERIDALAGQRVENRIAVGYSQDDRGDFRLEMRIQRRDLWAYRFAEAIAARARGDAHYEIIPRIEVPSDEQSKSHPPCIQTIIDRDRDSLEIGLSIGCRGGGVGTLGAFIRRSDGEYIMSCTHVLAAAAKAASAQNGGLGDPIFQPGQEADYRLDAGRQIARLSRFVALSRAVENEIDCALAKLEPGWQHVGTRVPVGRGYAHEGRAIRPMQRPDHDLKRDMLLCKIGRTTCYTRGLLRAVEIDRLPVFVPGEGNVLFSKVIEVRSSGPDDPFSLPGDSGSLVFTDDGHEAVGLVFAGGTQDDGFKVSYVCKLAPVLAWAQAELLN